MENVSLVDMVQSCKPELMQLQKGGTLFNEENVQMKQFSVKMLTKCSVQINLISCQMVACSYSVQSPKKDKS